MKYTVDRFAFHLFGVSVLLLVFSYGVAVGMFQVFPYPFVVKAVNGYMDLSTRYGIGTFGGGLPWYLKRVPEPYLPVIRNTGQAQPGVNLVTEIITGRQLSVKIMDMDAQTLHQWIIDWFKVWPDARHVPERFRPRSAPGTHIHGAILMENGDLVFNFEHLGLVRLDRQGEIVWRLPYQTHHSICRHNDGTLWVCGQKEHAQRDPRFPNQVPPFKEDMVLVVTPDGKIVQELSVPELLRKNGRHGLMFLGSLNNFSTIALGDVLHLNQVEPFPTTLKGGFFKKGDVLVSLRNINTVFVFNRETEKIKFMCTGMFVRQHDPHFIDGNRFSVFDNNNIGPEIYHPQSRIVIVSAPSKAVETYYQGTAKHPFYTSILGKHQWLANGHLLITESCEGKAFEIDRRGERVWEYVNYVDQGMVGILEQVQRLPLEYARRGAPESSRPDRGHEPGASAGKNRNGG